MEREDRRSQPAAQRQPAAQPRERTAEAAAQGAALQGSPRQLAQRRLIDGLLGGEEGRPRRLPSAAPGNGTVQRVLKVDGKPIANPADLGPLSEGLAATTSRLIALGEPVIDLTRAELEELQACLEGRKPQPSRKAKVAIVRLVSQGSSFALSDKRALAAFNERSVMANLNALDQFIGQNTNVRDNLRSHRVGFDMRSLHPQIKDFGGGAVIKDKIHLDDSVMTMPSKGFLRTAVHEMGHATFQRLLIRNEHWNEEANLGQKAPDEKALDDSGRKFYEAWSILRANPKYFFVKTLTKDKSEGYGQGRQAYLAKQFTEFCAESFMHLALEKGSLMEYIESLDSDDEVPEAVKTAWQDARTVLLQYESRILGSKPWEGGI